MSNNPPEIIIELTLDDANMLLEDSEAALHQCLGILNKTTPDQRQFAEKLVNLIEFKRRIKQAVEKGISQK